MLIFILGFIIGGIMGAGFMAILQARKAAEYVAEINRIKADLDSYEKAKYVRSYLDKTDGSCNCDDPCIYQRGEWKDMCALWKGKEK